MQTVAELRGRLPAPAQVHIGPQAALVLDLGNVLLQVMFKKYRRQVLCLPDLHESAAASVHTAPLQTAAVAVLCRCASSL